MNTLVIGVAGSGKSRNVIIPNVAQMLGSYVILDLCGDILYETGKMLMENGYTIKVIDPTRSEISDRYNPLDYVCGDDEEKEIQAKMLAEIIMENAGEAGRQDPFWEPNFIALLTFAILFVCKFMPVKERTMSSVVKLIYEMGTLQDENSNEVTALKVIADARESNPGATCFPYFDIFNLCPGKTKKAVIIEACAAMRVFLLDSVERILSTAYKKNDNDIQVFHNDHDISLWELGDKKTAIFLCPPVSERSYDLLNTMVFAQAMHIIRTKIYEKKSLKEQVFFIMDEFGMIKRIPQFAKQVSTMRTTDMRVMIAVQNIEQLKAVYPKDWQVITSSMGTIVVLGAHDEETAKYIIQRSESGWDGYIETTDKKGNKYGGRSFTRHILDRDQVMTIRDEKCLIFRQGWPFFFADKYDLSKHPRYNLLGFNDMRRIYGKVELLTYHGYKEEEKEKTETDIKNNE